MGGACCAASARSIGRAPPHAPAACTHEKEEVASSSRPKPIFRLSTFDLRPRLLQMQGTYLRADPKTHRLSSPYACKVSLAAAHADGDAAARLGALDLASNDVEAMRLGGKVELAERVVEAVTALGCPALLQAHQLSGLDFPALLPAVRWLVRRSEHESQEVGLGLTSWQTLLCTLGLLLRRCVRDVAVTNRFSCRRRETKSLKYVPGC